jgi:hypothetical protein
VLCVPGSQMETDDMKITFAGVTPQVLATHEVGALAWSIPELGPPARPSHDM